MQSDRILLALAALAALSQPGAVLADDDDHRVPRALIAPQNHLTFGDRNDDGDGRWINGYRLVLRDDDDNDDNDDNDDGWDDDDDDDDD